MPNPPVTLRSSNNGRNQVLTAVRAMLRPVIRLLIRSGIVHRDFVALTREVYVEIARQEFGLRHRPTSISRTALLTGLARKDVRRIVDRIDAGTPVLASQQDRITRVLSGWFHDPEYVDANGRPRPLPPNGPAPSFASLKKRYGGDVPASAMLRELLTAGTVEKLADGMLRPVHQYFMPDPADPQQLLRAASVVEDLGTTVTDNLRRAEDDLRLFERRVSNISMSEQQVTEFRDFLDTEGQRFLERVDRWLTEHETPSTRPAPVRLGVGLYMFRNRRT